MPETAGFGWPYPNASATPDVPADIRDLAEAIEPDVEQIASDLQTVDDRVTTLEGVVNPGVGWNIITPTIVNDGTATYSTRTGRWRRIGVLTVHVVLYFVCSGSGSGASTVTMSMSDAPAINRATRQMLPFAAEGMSGGGGGNRMGYFLSLTSGTSNAWDRIRFQDGVDSHLDNLTGADIVAGMILVAQGTYQEEEA